jgi:hypothetical protein
MADRTSNTTFYPGTDPALIHFKTNASDADTFTLPYGVAVEAVCASTDDDDEIATGVCSGSTVTIGLVDDAGSAVATDRDLAGYVILRNQ